MANRDVFDALRTEISRGITLVEASAGTGKTFAIAMLVLRAIVEHGIKIDQVLVVTFTIAATEELRERIRARLSQARDLLRSIVQGNELDQSDDPVLSAWSTQVPNPQRAVELLNLALLDIDCAAIHTIHGFCQRMLKEQALESGQLFDVDLTGDTTLVKSQLVQDYWRSYLYPLGERYCALVTSRYPSPDDLYRSITGAENILARLVPDADPIDEVCARLDEAYAVLKDWWLDHSGSLRTCFDAATGAGLFKKDMETHYSGWWDDLTACFEGGQAPDSGAVAWLQSEKVLQGLNGNKLRGLEKKQAVIADWPLPGDRVEPYLEAIERLIRSIRLDLAIALRKEIPERLRKQGSMSFDGLITGLAESVIGENGEELRRQIAARYRIALIDEFQDTDTAQWSIFSSLFGSGTHILFLIGDPKQAIYRFRGADIFSYFSAREKADNSLTLIRNFRSHPGLMAAVNDLFEGHHIAGENYCRVEPALTKEHGSLKMADDDLSGLVYCQLAPQPGANARWHSGAANDQIRKWIAAEIAALITKDSAMHIERSESLGTVRKQKLRPADIAILTRTNAQAELYQDSLGRLGIPSVISSKTPVFRTPEAQQLLLLLQAVAVPGDSRSLKAAVSCDWFGLSGDEHYRVFSNDRAMNRWHDRFQGYYHLWLEKGFLPMMSRLLVHEEVFVHLCDRPRAERRMANIQHLVELLQEAEQQAKYGIPQTILWLQKMAVGVLRVEEMELRLESDAVAVNILTMHGAKGLEFPIVFCPCLLASAYHGGGDPSIIRCHDQDGNLICDLGSDDYGENRARSLEEERQEDMRLAYVAVTRAQLRCYLFWAETRKWGASLGSPGSPLGQLLFPAGPGDFQEQQSYLRMRGETDNTDFRLIDAELVPTISYQPPDDTKARLQPRKKGDGSLKTVRTLTSFSGLAMLSSHDGDDVLSGAFDEGGLSDNQFLEISMLPGGVRFGNIVHDALEKLDFPDLAGEDHAADVLALLCLRYGLDIDLRVLQRLLQNTVTTTLFQRETGALSFCLAELHGGNCVQEMEFTLSLQATSTARLNHVLAAQQTCSPLAFREIEGYLGGYVDLICEHDGRYYIIDYKTNNLGEGPEHYSRKSMLQAMRLHNYGLQYWLYTLVVHRYLRRWLPGYSYGTHFGGIMYLFVRGMVPDRPGSGVFYELPEENVLFQLDQCFGGGAQ